MISIKSKLPDVGTTIFTIMSGLAAQHNAINLSQGFPDYECAQGLRDLVTKYMGDGLNQYSATPGILPLRERIAEKIFNSYQKDLDAGSEITVTVGGVQAIFTALTALIHRGDEVIVLEPAFDCYVPTIELMGAKAVVYRLEYPDYQVDWEAFGKLITPKTRMIMFNTPHNPTGKIWSEADMLALQALTLGTKILLLSDEVYEHIVYDGRRHESILRYPALWERSIVIYSFGKTFHTTGWRMGYCIAPEQLMKEFRKVHQFNVFCAVTPLQYALAEYMKDEQTYLGLPEFFQRKRDYLEEVMMGSRFKPISSEGTYFQVFDYSDISDEHDTDFVMRLVREEGIALIPMSAFYSGRYPARAEKVVRMCFAKREETLARGAEILRKI